VPAGFSDSDELIWTLTSHGVTERAYASLRTDYKLDTVSKMSETGALGAGSSSPEIRANVAPVVKLEGPNTRTVKVGEPLSLVAIVTDDGVPRRRGQRGGNQNNNQSTANPPAGAGAAGAAGAAAAGAGAAGAGAGRQNGDGASAPVSRGFSPPSRSTVGKAVGLHLSWFAYRGPGSPVFDPPQIKVWEDTRVGARSPWAPQYVPPAMPPDGRIETSVTFSEPGTYILRALADDGGLTGGQNVTVTVVR
jgi:hypothetical protein